MWFTCIKVSSLFPRRCQDVVHKYKSQCTFFKVFQVGIGMCFTCLESVYLSQGQCLEVCLVSYGQCTSPKVSVWKCVSCLMVSVHLPRPVSGSVSHVLWSVYISQGQCLEVCLVSYGQCTSPKASVRKCFTCLMVSVHLPRSVSGSVSCVLWSVYISQGQCLEVFLMSYGQSTSPKVSVRKCFTCLMVSVHLPRSVSGSVSHVLWSVYISQGQCLEVFLMSYGQCTSPKASVRKCFTCFVVSVGFLSFPL